MPFMTFSGISKEILIEVKEELVTSLAKAFDCPEDYIVLKMDKSENIFNVYPFVKIEMFRRSQECMNAAVSVLCNIFKRYDINSLDTAFMYYEPNDYYVNEQVLG